MATSLFLFRYFGQDETYNLISDVDFRDYLQAFPSGLAIHVDNLWTVGSFEDVYARDLAAYCSCGFDSQILELLAKRRGCWSCASAAVCFPVFRDASHRRNHVSVYDESADV